MMAKTMAVITGGIVSNMIWCSDNTKGTGALVDPDDRPVGIGDSYQDGKFYRYGIEILTPLEEIQKELAELKASYQEGVNSV